MLSKELTRDDWTKIARGEWKPKPYDLRMAGFDALKLLKRAESAEAELLSLREQLTELKTQEPAAWMDEKGNVCTIDNRLRGLTAECADAYRKYNIPLFTAAKPSED
ncbi:TPA: hypothetical protein PXN96_003846 [Yersinia enterocolitica]|nr:hypothetical protein [Yersinia enterocolitica]